MDFCVPVHDRSREGLVFGIDDKEAESGVADGVNIYGKAPDRGVRCSLRRAVRLNDVRGREEEKENHDLGDMGREGNSPLQILARSEDDRNFGSAGLRGLSVLTATSGPHKGRGRDMECHSCTEREKMWRYQCL